jgi:peptide/nickel transport system permease protein
VRAYLIRRLLLVIPTFLGVSLVTFLLIQSVPGSPVYMKLRAGSGEIRSDAATEEIVAQTKALYGLDKPVPVQYALWLGRMVTLDFGLSYKDNRPVLDKILEALPNTLQLNFASILLAYLIAIPIGVFSATHRGSITDTVITLLVFLLFSLPTFWVAMLLIMFVGGGEYANWFPIHGLSSIGAESLSWPAWLMDRLWHMVLPVFCLTYASLAGLSRFMRSGMLDTIRQDYVRTARAYGFSDRVVHYRYALRNALIPIITLLAGILPELIGGAIIIETIFSVPGMGRLAFEAMLSRDYPLVMGVTTFAALLTLAGLILSDILYAVVDPRIRLG